MVQSEGLETTKKFMIHKQVLDKLDKLDKQVYEKGYDCSISHTLKLNTIWSFSFLSEEWYRFN